MRNFEFTAGELPHDYHSAATISFGELADAGFIDWDAPEWQWDAYDDAQRSRLQAKIEARFWFRDIGVLPWARWRQMFVRKLNEIMPKYKLMYKKLNDEATDLFRVSDSYGKSRDVYSDFPASLLNGENEDYASHGSDHEHEDVVDADTYERLMAIAREYTDIDVMILDELDVLFSGLMTVNFNGL